MNEELKNVENEQVKILKYAIKEANRVDFLNEEERDMYKAALYTASMWGKRIDEENKKLTNGGFR